jgi:hypothetical protein
MSGETLMVAVKKGLVALVFAFAITAYGPVSLADQCGTHLTPARSAAIRECNDRASKFAQYVWGVTQLHIYRTCMAAHHEME